MELMMSNLHAGPAVAARAADTAEVTFQVRGSSSAAAGPGGLTEIQPFKTTDLDASDGAYLCGSQWVYRRPAADNGRAATTRSRYMWQ